MKRKGNEFGRPSSKREPSRLHVRLLSVSLLAFVVAGISLACYKTSFRPSIAHAAEAPPQAVSQIPRGETPEEAQRQSAGCVSCHTATDSASMHAESVVVIGCADCHGGDPTVMAAGVPKTAEYIQATRKAHVQPRFAEDAARGDS